MRVCVVAGDHVGKSVRLQRQIKTFRKVGYEIHLVCPSKAGQPQDDGMSSVAVHWVRPLTGFAARLHYLLFEFSFVDVRFLLKIRAVVREYKTDLLFVRNLPLILTTSVVKRMCGCKLVYDVNDRYPLAMNQWGIKWGWSERMLMSVARMERLEKRCLALADHIVVATPPYVDQFVKMGISREKLTLLPNYVDIDQLDDIRNISQANTQEPFIILYIGSFGRHRGLDTAIKAMVSVVKEIPDAQLILIGPLTDREDTFRRELEGLAQELGVGASVTFTGFLDFPRILPYLRTSNVCLIPFKKNSHTDTILPLKIFEYMAMSKPVVATNVECIRKIVESEGFGIIVSPDAPEEMARAIVDLHNDPLYALDLGRRGRKAVEERYNWEVGSREFIRMCRQMERALAE